MEQKKKFILAIPTIIIIIVTIVGISLIFYNRHFKELSREDAKLLAEKVTSINNISCEIVTESTMQGSSQSIVDYKLKDNKLITKNNDYLTYENDDINSKIQIDDTEKIAFTFKEYESDIQIFKESLCSAVQLLKSEECEYKFIKYETMNGIKCAEIELTEANARFDIWLDRKNGMIVKFEGHDNIEGVGEVTMTRYYRYQIGTVTDNDVSEPDLSGYTIEEL